MFLYCEECGAHYSADRGDYFMQLAEQVMRCDNYTHEPCDLILAREERNIIPITLPLPE